MRKVPLWKERFDYKKGSSIIRKFRYGKRGSIIRKEVLL